MKNSSLDKEMRPCNQLVSKRSSEEKSHKKVAKKVAIMITKSQYNILSQCCKVLSTHVTKQFIPLSLFARKKKKNFFSKPQYFPALCKKIYALSISHEYMKALGEGGVLLC